MYTCCIFIELTCTSNLIYDFSGEKCPDVCGLPVDRCSQSDREGCRCQDGYFRDGSASCVLEPDCGCSDPVTGSYYMVSICYYTINLYCMYTRLYFLCRFVYVGSFDFLMYI